jgi:hypothetical protein
VTEVVKVEGAETLRVTTKIAAHRIQDMSDPGERMIRVVAARGRSDAPVLTGRLANSIRSSASSSEAEATSALVYANRTHWGYRRYRQAAQPFLARQIWGHEPIIVQTYETRANQVLAAVRGV